MQQLLRLRYVGAGGAIGGLTRWLVLRIVDDHQALITVTILNVVGSILLGFLAGRAVPDRRGHARVTTNQFLLVGTGFCGALTTFSNYAVEVAAALDEGAIGRAAGTSLAVAALAVFGAGLGYRLGRLRRRSRR